MEELEARKRVALAAYEAIKFFVEEGGADCCSKCDRKGKCDGENVFSGDCALGILGYYEKQYKEMKK